MTLKLKKPIVFFDLETTGTNISNDKIVEYSFIKLHPDGTKEVKSGKVNPLVRIPVESSLIHGIYDEDVKDAPAFKDIAKSLDKFLENCDLSGFNVIRFDIPLLVEEFLRADINFDLSNRKLIDSQKIFHMMEKRNLTAAYKFYCDKALEGAHGAEADTVACMEVLISQVDRYEGQEMSDALGNTIGTIENDIDKLHKLTSTQMVDLAGRMTFNQNNVEVFNFGKHKGKPVLDVLEREPAYYDWMMRGDFPLDTKRKLTEIKLRSFNRGRN
ncbi:exonuclease domain-containing protein [Aureibacter tunicatorum]|uniref:DNA polymerase-3 subunit epsilon n=1 Tax=Aureibacter tunicatorum TaxID=866807 RepID=A0AAE3XNN7_9BACT|nr:exonuclease domain-containing protein [Aureibacter tunicatorum]MDR6239234.1 DNA polymerase-3 subunit epsilon [Aureibacter tunicatorum]BDD04841.1 DNA polymerase III subunit epsilon [Aureibacter tunicatorum]